MKKYIKNPFIILMTLANVGLMSGCGTTTTINENTELDLNKVLVNTYVGDNGLMVENISYDFNDINLLEDIDPNDINIRIGDDVYEVLSISEDNNTLNLDVEDFPYYGVSVYDFDTKETTKYDFNVETDNELLKFNKDTCEISKEIVDDFTQGTFKGSNGVELPYWIYTPENVNNLPVMLWEHGGGEVLSSSYEGANIEANKGATTWIENNKETIVVSFQYPKNYSFGISEKSDELKTMAEYDLVKYEFIQSLINEGKVDANRVYISGASSGGGAVLRSIMQYPDFFAAALVISAKDTIYPMSEQYGLAYKFDGDLTIPDTEYKKCYDAIYNELKDINMIDVPIWFVQAENDPITTSYTSKMCYEALNNLGAKNNKLTLYTDEEVNATAATSLHGSWVPALNNKDIIDWVFSQSK